MVFGTGIGRFAQPGEEKGDLAVFSYLWEGTGQDVESSQRCAMEGQETRGMIWEGNPAQQKEY